LPEFRSVLHQRRRVPFAEDDTVTLGFEPLVQQRQLRGFTGAVDSFDHKKFSGEVVVAILLNGRCGGLYGIEDLKRSDMDAGIEFHEPLSDSGIARECAAILTA